MKRTVVIAFVTIICLVSLFWITIETNPEIVTKLGYASGPGKPVEVVPDTPNAMVPSIMYEGSLTEQPEKPFLQKWTNLLLWVKSVL